MREIKFRAWDNYKNEMRSTVDLRSQYVQFPKCFVPMQYTGLKDKDGAEIYEGDVLRITRVYWYCPGHPAHNTDLIDQVEVYWDERRNAMCTRTFDFERLKQNPNRPPYSSYGYLGDGWNDERADRNIWEILGNIYENPELLNSNHSDHEATA